ncbi:MAG TPA: polysaccharide deacetylase family protein, partial [Dongiaceae bacterium]|nr:polysaccharide deacetylase family protein [Dongiaceae bacterium]
MRRCSGWVVAAGAVAVMLVNPCPGAAAETRSGAPTPRIAILCYHDISDDAQAPLQTVSAEFLRRQIRDCRAAGWSFISLAELLDHRLHLEQLPPKTLVLTFDDGYRSFRDRALPVLREEHVPATLAVITGFVDQPETGLPPLLGWDELREVARDPGVSIASHSHRLHRYEIANPYRDTAPSSATRRYLLAQRRYETREEYRARIRADLDTTQRVLRERLGTAADVLVWPYGMHNEMARGLADQAGFRATLALGGRAVTVDDLRSGCLPRIMVTRKFRFDAGDATWLEPAATPMRAADVDLDDVYSPDPNVFRDRLDLLVKRVHALGATHVFLSVCSDTAADGRQLASWCMNHQVRVRADVWSMVAFKLAQARIKVWARVPSMNLPWVWQQHPEWRIG